MSASGTQPGHVEVSTRHRADELRRELLDLLKVESDPHTTTDFQRYKKGKNGEFVTVKTGNNEHRVLEADPDREPVLCPIPNARGGILKKIIQHLVSGAFGNPSDSKDQRESAILTAAMELPKLCDLLEQFAGNGGSDAELSRLESGPKTDRKRTAPKKVARKKGWTTDCKRMKNEWFKECRKQKTRVSRISFIRRELRANGSRYPSAESASTIDKRFQDNPTEWKTELAALLQKSGPETDQ